MTDRAREWLETIYRTTGNTAGADYAKDILERLDRLDALAAVEEEIGDQINDPDLGEKLERMLDLDAKIDLDGLDAAIKILKSVREIIE